jgi:large conductance mechanosensitive channel
VPAGAWRTAVWDIGSVRLSIGDFAGAIVDFLIIGFIVWRISKSFIKPAAASPVRNCPYCRMAIDEAATRCAHCTSDLASARI